MTHTPEPWYVERPYDEPGVYIAAKSTALVCKLYPVDEHVFVVDQKLSIDDTARRIVACVNACKGIPTAVLEQIVTAGVNLLPLYQAGRK